MSTQIKVKNIFGQIITQQQQLLQDDHFKEHYENGNLKKIEYFFTGDSSPSLSYFMALGETLTTLLAGLVGSYKIVTLYFNKQTSGIYSIWDWEIYDGGAMVKKGREVFDNENRQIAFQDVDVNTQQVLRTKKRYYLTSLGSFAGDEPVVDNGSFEFMYDGHGTISVHVNLLGFELYPRVIDSTENILLHPSIAAIFNWSNHPYYHSASPFIP